MTTAITNIALVQKGPEFLDLNKSLDLAEYYSEKAAKANCQIIAFPECWLSGYPIWLDICPNINIWDDPATKEVWSRTYNSSVKLGGPFLNRLKGAAKRHKIYIVIGANEIIEKGPGNSTIYNAIFTIDDYGNIVNHHRKLMPTHTERLVHGYGDGHGLKAVETNFGRIGSLICWEHWMPLSRMAMHIENEHIHFALWPQVKEMNLIASKQYAFEGRCFVIALGQTMKSKELPSELTNPHSNDPERFLMNGGTCAFAPDGNEILSPLEPDVDFHVLSLENSNKYLGEKMNLSVAGHYNRPDVFELKINKKRIHRNNSDE